MENSARRIKMAGLKSDQNGIESSNEQSKVFEDW